MIKSYWPRIAGIHCQDDGSISAIWIAHDKDADTLHLYDSATFRREVMAVIAEGLNKRGKWIPIAWHDDAREIVDLLLDKGCNVLPDAGKNSDPIAETISLDIWEMMRTGRFKVSENLTEWLDEYRTFHRQDSRVPRLTHPLMASTRHAVAQLDYALAKAPISKQGNYPKVAIL